MRYPNPESIRSPETKETQTEATPQPVETLLHPELPNSPWPEQIKNNPELINQSEIRNNCYNQLNSLFEKVPSTTEITDAIDSGQITEQELIATYSSLIQILNDESNHRLILYLPFELLPNKNSKYNSEQSKKISDDFTAVYLNNWNKLLSVHDVRANFSDGDVPDINQRNEPLTRVSKAAHLIPKLVEKNILSPNEAINLLENTNDEILEDSICDTIGTLVDLNLLTQEHLEQMAKSNKSKIRNISIIAKSYLYQNTNVEKPKSETIENLLTQANQELLNKNSKIDKNITESRKKWLAEQIKDTIINKYSEKINQNLVSNQSNTETIKNLLAEDTDDIQTQVAIKSLENFLLTINNQDNSQAKNILEELKPELNKIWHQNSSLKTILTNTFIRLNFAKIIETEYLTQLGITLPNLEGKLPNENPNIKTNLAELSDIASTIEKNPELSKILYPVSIIYGSKIKGYADENADTDIAVFIKPEADIKKRADIQTLLSETFKNYNKPLEFWLTKDNEHLKIKDFQNIDTTLGDSSLTHVLFEGIWCGDQKSIQELHQKLLTSYLYNNTQTKQTWLEEMERDTLQYRLLHKGYQKFFPKQGGIHTNHSYEIDSETPFYDSGYRRLATKLFLNKVYLPKIK